MSDSLVAVLHAEIVRVREQVLPAYEAIGAAGAFARVACKETIWSGEAALRSGDIGEMVRAVERLGGCTA